MSLGTWFHACSLEDDRVFTKITSCSFFEVSCQAYSEQLVKRQCTQSNINPDGPFCAGFIQKIQQNELVIERIGRGRRATDCVDQKWQEVVRGIAEAQKRFLAYYYRPGGPVEERLAHRRYEQHKM